MTSLPQPPPPEQYPDFSGNKDNVLPTVRTFKAMLDKKEAAAKALKGITEECQQLEQELYKLMEKETLQSLGLDGTLYFRKTGKYFSIKKERFEDAHTWLKANDFGDLFKETINSRTLSTELKRSETDDEVEIPEDLFNHTTKTQIGRRKQP